ncbi:Alginate export [Singulisphaera sp. GP187]|uniref:alginate export family protein n=1 Tax=Singulisphaera sp. GP187 TaxID=1882752 RepID=UPI0009260F79|nr:alginate export family protein [Singulisphaera sp. GP187]SIO33619.1 Alginate export [Singulisphaera sp. GP187]
MTMGNERGSGPRHKSPPTRVLTAIAGLLLTLSNSLYAQSPTAPPSSASAAALPVGSGAVPTQPAAPTRLGPGSDAIAGSDVPTYKLLRYNEDYSDLKDPGRRTDFWDPIKYIPVGEREGWYSSFGGQFRPRFEFYNNFDFGTIPGGNGYLLQRYLLHGDFHFGPNVRFFGQFVSGFENGRIGGPRPDIDENIFDGHQAFLDVVQHFGEKDTLTWRVGRQEMSYGSERLISVREGVNLRRSFDAARLLLRVGDWSVDGFWSKPVLNRPGVFDDIPNPKLSLWGIYAVRPLKLLPEGHADFYYLGYENKQATFDQSTGNELRNSLGTRFWGLPLPWEYNVEAIWQFGRFGHGNLQAWAIASAVRYTFQDRSLRPRLGLIADIASGDQNPRSANLQTFNPMFPTGAYLNLANPIGPANFIQVHPTADVRLGDDLMLKADWAFVWRQSINDGIYGPFVGPPIRTGQLSQKRFVGSSPAVTLTWNATRHLTLLASYVHFFAGPFLKETPPGRDMDYATLWIDYTF